MIATGHEHSFSAVFDRLDAWRHFPAYQLERRADIFFSLYLREVIEKERGVKLADIIIPEIPIKLPGNNQSVKADYLLTSSDHACVYLVELKTDPLSRRDEQDVYLAKAAAAGIEALLEGIRSVVLATTSHGKYFHLLHELEALGFLQLPTDLADYVFNARRGRTQKLREISLTVVRPRIEVVWVQPSVGDGDPSKIIDFECFARHVASHTDPLSQRFSESLRSWTAVAGSTEPTPTVAKCPR